MWNLEKWYRRAYLKGRNRVTGGNRHMNTGLWGRGGMNWVTEMDICAVPRIKQRADGNLPQSTGSPAPCSVT